MAVWTFGMVLSFTRHLFVRRSSGSIKPRDVRAASACSVRRLGATRRLLEMA
jgi:hypothetical protein